MKALLNSIKWDFLLIAKYGIVAIAIIIALIYCVTLFFLDTQGLEKLIAAIIFSDPVMYGFLFTAVIILFEKDANTHQVLAVTPMPVSRYIWSKAIVFTLLALVLCTAIILSAQPDYFCLFAFVFGIVLSAPLFVFIGIIGVSYAKNFNQFFFVMPIVLMPVSLPFLDFFSLYESPIFYVIPTQGCLLLFKAAISTVETWQIVYSIVYLIICNFLFFRLAKSHYKRRILKISRYE